jgi:hypothetical protein
VQLDISHHFGPLTCFFIELGYNRKLILMGAGASHPAHWHPKRTETYKLLWGDVDFGETKTVQPREVHSFSTVKGCVIEEIGDREDVSIYVNPLINDMPREQRKTYIEL